MQATLARIERFNPIVNAYCHLDAAGALAAAKASEARWRAGSPKGLVDGVPVGVKDNIHVAGMPSRFGSKLTPDAPQKIDAPAVARLKEQGAIVLGKTAMPEYGWKATSDSPLTGITRNPWDTRMTTGGSSAGAVASAVLGMGALHLGTDGGGSIRIPAAFTGCYGLKPTRARVPAFPASPLGTLAHHGPLTRTVADAALAMTVIAAPDARDVYGWTSPAPDYRAGLDDGVRGLRIAYSPTLGGIAKRVHPEVARLAAAAAKAFADLGATVEEADPDLGADPIDAWNAFWWPGMALQLQPSATAPGPGRPGPAGRGGARPDDDAPSSTFAPSCRRAELHNMFAQVPRALRSAAHPRHAAARLRGRPSGAAVGRLGQGVDRLGALQLPLQPDPAAGRLRPLRPHQPTACRWACRSSARSAPTPWCCAPAAPSRPPHPFPTLDAPRQKRPVIPMPSLAKASGTHRIVSAAWLVLGPRPTQHPHYRAARYLPTRRSCR